MIEATTHVIIKTKLWIQFSIDKKFGFENWQRQGHYYDGNLYWIKKTNDEKNVRHCKYTFCPVISVGLKNGIDRMIDWSIFEYLMYRCLCSKSKRDYYQAVHIRFVFK